MFIKRTASLLLAGFFMTASLAHADTKIGFVNTEKLLLEAPLSIAAQKKT
jgi:outer membrane protein